MSGTGNLPLATTAKEVVVNEDLGGGLYRSARQTLANLAAQLNGSGALKTRLDRLDPSVIPTLTIATDANFTVTFGTGARNIRHTGTLTAARTVTVDIAAATDGDEIWITRSGGGAFNLNVGTGPLKAVPASAWVCIGYSSSLGAAYLKAYGTL
jgi:hypothetical protein